MGSIRTWQDAIGPARVRDGYESAACVLDSDTMTSTSATTIAREYRLTESDCEALADKATDKVVKRLMAVIHNLSRLCVPPLRVGPDEMARLLGISRRTLSDWMRKRLIPFERIGPKKGRSTVLFDRDDVDKALKRWRVKSVGD